MTLQNNLYCLWFVIPALLDWQKERFSNHFENKYDESNHVSPLLVFPVLSNWIKGIIIIIVNYIVITIIKKAFLFNAQGTTTTFKNSKA